MAIDTVADYGNKAYWDKRYTYSTHLPASFDWYQNYAQLRVHLLPYLGIKKQRFSILIAGCGSSTLGADLYMEGYRDIYNIDFSPVVIERMSRHYAHLSDMEFFIMDARNMAAFPDQSFDLVIDKALLDAQLCTSSNVTHVASQVQEMYRVLKPGGNYIVISHGGPDTRLGYLTSKRLDWTITDKAIDKPPVHDDTYEEKGAYDSHYMYVCQRNSEDAQVPGS